MVTTNDWSLPASEWVHPPVHTVLVWSVMLESVSYISMTDLLPCLPVTNYFLQLTFSLCCGASRTASRLPAWSSMPLVWIKMLSK